MTKSELIERVNNNRKNLNQVMDVLVQLLRHFNLDVEDTNTGAEKLYGYSPDLKLVQRKQDDVEF